MLIAKRIREIRNAHGLTQAEVADKCEMTPSAYGKIEREAGNCKLKTLQKVADALGVTLLFLIDIKNDSYIEAKYLL